jgi:enoyl-CoA hydratase/carnithine racemase
VGYHASGIEMLQNLVGPSRAKEIFFTARRYAAAEALAIGLVNEVVPVDALLGRVRDVARRIADNAPLTIASVKQIVSQLALPREHRDHRAIDASIAACFGSEDYREGVAAFLAKRKPKFSGR